MKVTAEELWKLNRGTADACLAHPFVQGIAVFKDLLVVVFEELTLHKGYA